MRSIRVVRLFHTQKGAGSNPALRFGELVEWFKTPVLKTGGCKSSVGSNPTLPVNNAQRDPPDPP